MGNVAQSAEDNKAAKDTGQTVERWHDQGIPVDESRIT